MKLFLKNRLCIALLWIKLAVGFALSVTALAVDGIDPSLVLLLSLPFLSSAIGVLTYKTLNRNSKFGWMAGMGLLDSLIGIGIGIFVFAVYNTMAVVATLAAASQTKVEMYVPWVTTATVAIIFTLASIVYTIFAFKAYRRSRQKKKIHRTGQSG